MHTALHYGIDMFYFNGCQLTSNMSDMIKANMINLNIMAGQCILIH